MLITIISQYNEYYINNNDNQLSVFLNMIKSP